MSDEVKRLELKPEELLLLEQPTLRMSHALARHSFKTAQRTLEHEVPKLLKEYAAIQKASVDASDLKEEGDTQGDVEMAEATEDTSSADASSTDPSAILSRTDALLAKLRALKDNLSDLHAKEQKATQSSKARLNHLQKLYEFNSLTDVRYEQWSKDRLARLEVDYLLRQGHYKTAQMLSDKCGIGELVDIEAFEDAGAIERSLRDDHDPEPALKWCKDNAQQLKKVKEAHKDDTDPETLTAIFNKLRYHRGRGKRPGEDALKLMKYHGLEFELRFQQCIEMARRSHDMMRSLDEDAGDYKERERRSWALQIQCQAYACKHLGGELRVMGLVSAMTATPEYDTPASHGAYSHYYSEHRWNLLAQLFAWIHNELNNLPQQPVLATALCAGISALKTPACHSKKESPSANATTGICPVCSVELNELAREVKYAHHTKSRVEDDPVVLPTEPPEPAPLYGRKRLMEFNKRVGGRDGMVRDPLALDKYGRPIEFAETLLKKVYVP